MREPTYYVLASLIDGPLHGYAMIKSAEALSGGRVRLTAGTLYGALDRLADQGLVEVTGEEIVDGRARRYYRLTHDGGDALAEEANRMAQAARVVRSRTTMLRQVTA
jgi:PadR family transcriptional regulator, regulatory protein PadR